MLQELLFNLSHNLFKPLLLFFYLGFAIPLLDVPFEFPKPLYKSLTLYLLLAIGWHGGEELAQLAGSEVGQAVGLMCVGFLTNGALGFLAYGILRKLTKLRKVDAAAVAGYYGSDSAGTFVTCLGVLAATNIAFDAYMPVMLAIMEIPGCLVALILINRLRRHGMDPEGNMPGEDGYTTPASTGEHGERSSAVLDKDVLREVFLNPGLYFLLGGILIGYVSRAQGIEVTAADDIFFIDLFQGVLCIFLLEMGITAARRLQDLKQAGWRFIAFGLITPTLFATIGMIVAHLYSFVWGGPLELGSYALFAVLCGAASYIAVPAIQRVAFPEASPTLPLASSLGLTFTYNVTVGIPVYIMLAKMITSTFPVA